VTDATILDEAASKALLQPYGLDLPQNLVVKRQALPDTLPFGYPVVLKAMGQAHKSEMDGVKLNLADRAELEAAMAEMKQPIYLIEEMVGDGLIELLVGVVADPAHGYLLTLAAGGVLTEILKDSVSLSLPVEEADILTGLEKLKIAPLLAGYRGKPAVDKAALVTAVLAVQDCVLDNRASFSEIELNPLILTPTRAVAVDALIKTGGKSRG
jgi:succinyl-CoA synthetase beta subunit